MSLRSLPLALACLLALALAPAAAQAATPVIGYGDQRAEMFSDPLFTGLGIRDSRVVVEWDTFRYPDKTARLDAWMAAAKAARVRPLVAIEHSWTPGRERLAPTPAQYTSLIRRLRARYPEVGTFSPWNEANHASQPTARRPALAATYWRLMRQACPGCTVTSPVYLDLATRSSARWLAAFKKASGGRVRLWAIHGYGDLNRGSDRHLGRALSSSFPGRSGSPRPPAGSPSARDGGTTRPAPPARSATRSRSRTSTARRSPAGTSTSGAASRRGRAGTAASSASTAARGRATPR